MTPTGSVGEVTPVVTVGKVRLVGKRVLVTPVGIPVPGRGIVTVVPPAVIVTPVGITPVGITPVGITPGGIDNELATGPTRELALFSKLESEDCSAGSPVVMFASAGTSDCAEDRIEPTSLVSVGKRPVIERPVPTPVIPDSWDWTGESKLGTAPPEPVTWDKKEPMGFAVPVGTICVASDFTCGRMPPVPVNSDKADLVR